MGAHIRTCVASLNTNISHLYPTCSKLKFLFLKADPPSSSVRSLAPFIISSSHQSFPTFLYIYIVSLHRYNLLRHSIMTWSHDLSSTSTSTTPLVPMMSNDAAAKHAHHLSTSSAHTSRNDSTHLTTLYRYRWLLHSIAHKCCKKFKNVDNLQRQKPIVSGLMSSVSVPLSSFFFFLFVVVSTSVSICRYADRYAQRHAAVNRDEVAASEWSWHVPDRTDEGW